MLIVKRRHKTLILRHFDNLFNTHFDGVIHVINVLLLFFSYETHQL